MKTTKSANNARRAKRLGFTLQIASEAQGIPASVRLKAWACAALEHNARVTVRVVDGQESRALNRRYRGRDYATNVLTFTYPELPTLAGDIVLCAPVIRREARVQGKTLDAHYAHLVVHGMLHLQGHDHQAQREATRMQAREIAILDRLGYANPYLPARP
jgi:probable rRNA maturation factor